MQYEQYPVMTWVPWKGACRESPPRTSDTFEGGLAGAQADLLLSDGHAGLVVAPLIAHQRQQLPQLQPLARVERLLL